MAFARHEFRMSERDKDGVSMREKLERVWHSTKVRPVALDGPWMPVGMAYIWDWFLDLSSSRGNSGFGPNPISYQEICAWMALTGNVLRRDEIQLVRALDREFISYKPQQPQES